MLKGIAYLGYKLSIGRQMKILIKYIMQSSKNYSSQKQAQQTARNKKQQQTQQKLNQIFNKTQKIISELSNLRERQPHTTQQHIIENQQTVSKLEHSRRQLSRIQVLDLSFPASVKKYESKLSQTEYEESRIIQRQQCRSSTTKCFTQHSQTKKQLYDHLPLTKSINLTGIPSNRHLYPASTVIIKQICLKCAHTPSQSLKRVQKKQRSKGIQITSCSRSHRYNRLNSSLKSEQKMKGHSRNPSASIKKKISLVKNIYNNPFLHNIRGV